MDNTLLIPATQFFPDLLIITEHRNFLIQNKTHQSLRNYRAECYTSTNYRLLVYIQAQAQYNTNQPGDMVMGGAITASRLHKLVLQQQLYKLCSRPKGLLKHWFSVQSFWPNPVKHLLKKGTSSPVVSFFLSVETQKCSLWLLACSSFKSGSSLHTW